MTTGFRTGNTVPNLLPIHKENATPSCQVKAERRIVLAFRTGKYNELIPNLTISLRVPPFAWHPDGRLHNI